LPKHGIDARQIVLTASPGALPGAMDAIRATGARLALDRVLSADGGLMSLAAHQPDFIAFGSEVLGGERNLAILGAAAGIARTFDVGIVVREVEEPEQIEQLRAIGVTTATGPAFGFALNAKSIAELLAAAGRPEAAALVA
jgi:EAL domain-containing protein (putative c-di-GMP-specific phosphodiesterase class I)